MDTIIVDNKIIKFINYKIVGKGSFGKVYSANISETGEKVAIKKFEEDPKYINREVDIISKLSHPNVIKLRYDFYTKEDKKKYSNLVFEYMPYSLHQIIKKNIDPIPLIIVKIYMYQLCRSIAYIHSLNITHRDIKPQNILVDPNTEILKICDFGSAKTIKPGEESLSYICSRYYRAPELILGATIYTNAVDIWSIGCVFAEILLTGPLFKANKNSYMFEEFIKILGKPTEKEILSIDDQNTYDKYYYNIEQKYSLRSMFSEQDDDFIDLLSRMLKYNPNDRITCIHSLNHPFFNELKNSESRLPNGKKLPPLFNFSVDEFLTLDIDFVKSLNKKNDDET